MDWSRVKVNNGGSIFSKVYESEIHILFVLNHLNLSLVHNLLLNFASKRLLLLQSKNNFSVWYDYQLSESHTFLVL